MVKAGKNTASTADVKVQASLEKLRIEKAAAVAAEDFAKALELKQQEKELIEKLRPALESELEKVQAEKKQAIASEDFAKALALKKQEQDILAKLDPSSGQTQEDNNQPSTGPTIGGQVRVLEGEHQGIEATVMSYKAGWWQLQLNTGGKLALRSKSLETVQASPAKTSPSKTAAAASAPHAEATDAKPTSANASPSKTSAAKAACKATSSQAAVQALSDATDVPVKKKPGRPKSIKAATPAKAAPEVPQVAKAEAPAAKKKPGLQVGKTALSLKKKQSEEKASGTKAEVETEPSSKKARTDTPSSAAGGGAFNALFNPGRKSADGVSDAQNMPVCTPEKSLRQSAADDNPSSSLKERSSQAQKSTLSHAKEAKDIKKEDVQSMDASARAALDDEVADARELTSRILSELFPVLDRASFDAPEDDADILPAPTTSKGKKRVGRTSAEAINEDHTTSSARMLYAFHQFLLKDKKEGTARSYLNCLKKLFEKDGLSPDSMATDDYVADVKQRPENKKGGGNLQAAAQAFKIFWESKPEDWPAIPDDEQVSKYQAADGDDEKMEEGEQDEDGRAAEEALQAEDEREREERQALKAAFAAVENAPNEDFDRFPMVAASFKLYLQGTEKLEDKEADERIKVFYELFQQDGKSIEAMASETYARLVKSTNRPMEEETVDLFRRCWSQISNGPFAEAQPREERGQERRLRIAIGLTKDWGVRVWQRAHLEDLAIITSPDGSKIFEVVSSVQDLDIFKGSEFVQERERLAREEVYAAQMRKSYFQSSAARMAEDEAARKCFESDKEQLNEKLCSISKTFDSTFDEDMEKKEMLPLFHRLVCSCASCGRTPLHLGDTESRGDAKDEDKPTIWNSYDDMPDATEEEKEQYPYILASFHYAGFEYVTGLRKLMELHKKKPMDMATPAYKRFVARDPENAQCNGFLNSAVLYFIKFREEGGFDKIMSPSEFNSLKENEQNRFTPDFERGTLFEQVGWDDLQIEIPLERMMVDATEAWHKEMIESLTCDRFITEDIDASGYQAKAFSISLLPDATPEEWQRWPRILAKFERTMKEQSAEATGMKREQEATNLFLALKDLVEEHGKSPITMASKRYVRTAKKIYTDKIKQDAAARFAEFWDEHKDGDFPEPKVHAFSKDKYTVVEQERVEAAKKVANQWDLPQGWAVKLKKDGAVLKVCGPGTNESYRTLEEAHDKAIEKAKKQAEEVQSKFEAAEATKDARLALTARQVGDQASAAPQETADEVMSEKPGDSMVDGESARDLALSLRHKPGQKPKTIRTSRRGEMPKIDRIGGKGGGKGGKRKIGELTAQERLTKVPLKVRKTQGLGRQQAFQAAACELILKAFEWRVVGIRVGNEIRPFDSEGIAELPKSEVRLVLAYVFEDVRQQKIRRIVESWNLDDNFKVVLRVRLSGDQVTAYRLSDGKSFNNLNQLLLAPPCQITLQKERLEVADMMQRVFALLRMAQQETIWELEANTEACLSGFYRKTNKGFERVWAEKVDDSGMCISLLPTTSGDAWEFCSEDGSSVLARVVGGGSNPICESTRLELCSLGGEAASEECTMKGMIIESESLRTRVISEVSASRSAPCRCGKSRAGRIGRPKTQRGYQSGGYQSGFEMKVLMKNQAYEQRLEELAAGREAAPRTLLEIVEHMLGKLPATLNIEDGSIPTVFHESKTLRIGTMCSGTDSPVICARTLQRALDARGSGLKFEHTFSVEIDIAKQEFLRANFPECPLIFQDVTQMGRARAWDTISQAPQPVPGDLDILIAGFSCKDLSMMNSYRKTLMEMGQSGATLRGVLNYIDRYKPRIVLLENVWAIAKENTNGFRQVDLVMAGLQARGYAAGYNLLNSCDFYLPQIRHRIWMWAVRIDDVAFDPNLTSKEASARTGVVSKQLSPKYVKILQGLEEPCALHFEDCLLDDDHPAVRKYINFMKSSGRRDVLKKGKGVKRDWISKYSEHRDKKDYQFDTPYTSVRGEEFLEVLNKREKELLDLKCLDVLSERGVDPRKIPMLWELSQSVERVPGTRVRRDRQNYATCILPGMLWHSSRHRWVLGVEKLALQGIFAQDLRDTDFPQKLLGDLAGNAFTTSVCAANLIAVLICAADVNKRQVPDMH